MAQGPVKAATPSLSDRLQDFADQVCELGQACSYDEAREIIYAAVQSGLPMSAMDHLVDIMVENTQFKLNSFKSMIKEARCTSEEYGEVSSLRAASVAFIKSVRAEGEHQVWVGDALYTYHSAMPGHEPDECGYFKRYSREILHRYILEDFGYLDFMQRESARKEVLKQLETELREDDYFAASESGLCVQNGFLTLDDQGALALREHNVEQRARLKLPFVYDDSAEAGWVQAGFARVLQDESKLEALQEALGATLFNVTPWGDEARRIIVLYGPQRSGKSTILELLQNMFPEEAVTSVEPSEWGRDYKRAVLDGKALNLVTELGGNMKLPAEDMKKIASCEMVMARHPYGRAFNFRPTAWHWFATNELPRTTDKSSAFERRLLCISFDRSLRHDEIDPDFVSRLHEAPSALVKWAGEGAQRLLTTGRFTQPQGHDEACARIRFGCNVPAILARRIEYAPGERLTTAELKEAALQLADELGISDYDPNSGEMKMIANHLKELYGATRHTSNGKPFYKDVRFRKTMGA